MTKTGQEMEVLGDLASGSGHSEPDGSKDLRSVELETTRRWNAIPRQTGSGKTLFCALISTQAKSLGDFFER